MRAGIFSIFLKNRLAVIGLLLVVFMSICAVLAPYLAPFDPNWIDTRNRLAPPATTGHWLGTDEFGRDMLSRLLWGARVSLFVGISATLIALILGSGLGLVAGIVGGKIDMLIMRLIDILMAFPYFLLAIAIIAAFGPGLLNGMLAVAVVNIPVFARIVRGTVLSIREMEYVEAAKALGASSYRISYCHILRNALAPIIVTGTLTVGWMIAASAGLSFLGLGVQPPTSDWGTMLSNSRQYMNVAPHVAAFPGLAIFSTVLGFNLLGDGLRDALDPRLKV